MPTTCQLLSIHDHNCACGQRPACLPSPAIPCYATLDLICHTSIAEGGRDNRKGEENKRNTLCTRRNNKTMVRSDTRCHLFTQAIAVLRDRVSSHFLSIAKGLSICEYIRHHIIPYHTRCGGRRGRCLHSCDISAGYTSSPLGDSRKKGDLLKITPNIFFFFCCSGSYRAVQSTEIKYSYTGRGFQFSHG